MTLRRNACGADPEFVSALHSRVEGLLFEVFFLLRFQASAVCFPAGSARHNGR